MKQEQMFSKANDQDMVIYPSKRVLLLNATLALFFVFASIDYLSTISGHIHPSTGLFSLIAMVIISVVIVFGSIFCILMLLYTSLLFALSVYRLLIPSPTLIVDNEGIHTTPCLLSLGTITITWEEIVAISFSRVRFKTSRAGHLARLQSFRCLCVVIAPEYEETVLSRQNRLNKVFFQSSMSGFPPAIFIPGMLLPFSWKKFLAQFQSTYHTQIEQHNIHIGNGNLRSI